MGLTFFVRSLIGFGRLKGLRSGEVGVYRVNSAVTVRPWCKVATGM